MKTMKMRGQAFVVFKDIRSATKAIDGANRASLFGKQMDVSFAKTKSKSLLEHQGKLAQAAAIRKKNNSFGPSQKGPHHKGRGNKNGDGKEDVHSRLRLENVPGNSYEEIKKIFGRFPGFIKVHYDELKPGLCFVEYSNQNQSITAMDKLQGFNIEDSSLRVTLDNFM